ncbi:MAG: 5-methyltetrahydropteroyltriglutamate--homocysteine S-methyltransferase, partial [Dehalococcoidia bacterium]
MAIATNLGYPRIGPDRELKRAVEAYWSGKTTAEALHESAAAIRRQRWEHQHGAGIWHIPSNDFSLYDHVLDTMSMVGAVPARYGSGDGAIGLDTYFAMARGTKGTGRSEALPAMEMTKWFDTNYHYIVPEFEDGQVFGLASTKPIDEFLEAKALGIHTRPVLLGPVTFLLLGKARDGSAGPLSLVNSLVGVYEEVLRRLADAGATWVQMDEPCLSLTLSDEAKGALVKAYQRLGTAAPALKLLVANYFGDLRDNLETALALPVAGLHVDLVRGPGQLEQLQGRLGAEQVLSVGVVDGRNIWRTDLEKSMRQVTDAVAAMGTERVFIAPSCSLLHSPVDLESETSLDDEMKSWMAFARQKVQEIAILARGVNEGREAVAGALAENAKAMETRRSSPRIHNGIVKERMESITPAMLPRQSAYAERRKAQQDALAIPRFPTTTIGSFPQTREVRKARADFRAKRIS